MYFDIIEGKDYIQIKAYTYPLIEGLSRWYFWGVLKFFKLVFHLLIRWIWKVILLDFWPD